MNHKNIYINLEDIIYSIYEGIQWYVSCKIRMINWQMYNKCILIEMYFLLLKVLLHDDKNYNKREISNFFGIIYLIINIHLSFVSNLDFWVQDLWLRFNIEFYSILLLGILRCTIQASSVTINNLDYHYFRCKSHIRYGTYT